MDNRPLGVAIEDDEIVIRIGVNTLAFAFENGDNNNPFNEKANDYIKHFKVVNVDDFAKDVCTEIDRDMGDGSTPLTHFFDRMLHEALEQGCRGIDYATEAHDCPDCNHESQVEKDRKRYDAAHEAGIARAYEELGR